MEGGKGEGGKGREGSKIWTTGSGCDVSLVQFRGK